MENKTTLEIGDDLLMTLQDLATGIHALGRKLEGLVKRQERVRAGKKLRGERGKARERSEPVNPENGNGDALATLRGVMNRQGGGE